MPEKEAVYKTKVRHVGMFDFKETYRVFFEWFTGEGYDVYETVYKEIIGANGMKEVDIFWDVSKSVSNYFGFFISIRLHPLAMTSVEVEIDGVKQKMNKGDYTIEIGASLLKDMTDTFSGNNFVKSLRKNYDKYLIAERIQQHKEKLIAETDAFAEYAKSYLALTGRK